MPARRSQPSEAHPEPRRSSLRRLSSIASLHALNPFARRRSNHTDNSPSANASNASLSSTGANTSHRPPDFATPDASCVSDISARVPPLPALPLRRSNYICLADDPSGGMPRSRTFSNLPLPSRAKKSTSKLQQSKSQAPLPSYAGGNSNTNLPPSRLPTPTFSTRKHSSTRLVSSDGTRKKLMRSETEPLLAQTLERDSSMPRMTAFKENISLSPIKPLSPCEDDWFSFSPRGYNSRQGWFEDARDAMPSSSEGPPGPVRERERRATARGMATRRLSQKFESSPAYRSTRRRAPTPGKPVQRWNSQPVLTNRTNVRNSYGSEIKQTRLLSARQAPTPPPTQSPSAELLLKNARARAYSNASTSRLRMSTSQQPLATEPYRLQPPASRARADSSRKTPGAITSAQPLTYWTGRYSSLNDRYRNEELQATDLSNPSIAKFETDKIHSTEANYMRMRRAIRQLHALCATPEAEQSFFVWQRAVASVLAIPELATTVRAPEARTCALEMSLRGGDACTPSSEVKKMNFVDRLLGRKQKLAVERSSMAPEVGGF